MCEFVTAILPGHVDTTKAQGVFQKHWRGFKPLDSYRIAPYLGIGDLYILTTYGMCDCGTALGRAFPPDPELSPEERARRKEAELKKLRSKGWSDNRIKRWLEQEKQNLTFAAAGRGISLEEDLNSWNDLIHDLLNSGITNRVGLLVHSYKTGVENERLPKLGVVTVSKKELNTDFLAGTLSDVIYNFVDW